MWAQAKNANLVRGTEDSNSSSFFGMPFQIISQRNQASTISQTNQASTVMSLQLGLTASQQVL